MRQALLLAVLLLLGGCWHGTPEGEEGGALVFVLDSPVHRAFLEGRVLGLRSEDITHGSLVARVLRSYCRATLAPVPVEGLDGAVDQDTYLDGLRTVLEYVRRQPSRPVIVNISLANPVARPEEEALIRRLTEAGALVVAAAGNEDSDQPFYPAAYPDVVAVASATPQGKALHSNYGPHVDIAASGDISFIDYEFLPYERLRREMEARGTSFAAPRVAGTVAYLVNHSSMSPAEAYAVIAETARPIADPYYRSGLLGAGLLDVLRARSRVSPGYRFAHLVLPMAVLALLAVASGYLCARHGLPGVFLSVMAWLIALPGACVAAVQLGHWLEFVGGGSLVVGLGAGTVLCAGFALALVVQQCHVVKTLLAAALPAVALTVAAGTGAGGAVGPIYLACAAAAATCALAAAWEVRTRRLLARLAEQEPPGQWEAAEALVRLHRHAMDRRVRRRTLRMLAQVHDERAAEFLLRSARDGDDAAKALAAMGAADFALLRPLVAGYRALELSRRERLVAALRQVEMTGVGYILRRMTEEEDSEGARMLLDDLGDLEQARPFSPPAEPPYNEV